MDNKWSWRHSDYDDCWQEIRKPYPYWNADDAAQEASEAYFNGVGGACDWPPESEETIEIKSPSGDVTKHVVWWQPSIEHLARPAEQ